jgi:hypothetical protein
MVIRPEQWNSFQKSTDNEFIRRLAEVIRDVHADIVNHLNDRELQDLVEVGLARARRHDLSLETSIATFVSLMFEFGPNFDEQPAIAELLREPGVPADERIDLVVDYASEQDWDDVDRLRDDSGWD